MHIKLATLICISNMYNVMIADKRGYPFKPQGRLSRSSHMYMYKLVAKVGV